MIKSENESIKVSILCLTYNHEKYIRQTLEGFINQKTNFDFEVLVHDDASTDHTADIIREYQQKYPLIIKPVYQTENQYSKNIGIAKTFLFPKAQGKYFAFCEGDDFWCDQTKLQRQYDVMENNPECSMCVHKVMLIHEDGTLLGEIIPQKQYHIEDVDGVLQEDVIASSLWLDGSYPFQTSSYFLRRDVMEERFKSDLTFEKFFNGDQVMLRIALKFGSIYYLKESMSCYRWNVRGSWDDRYKKASYEEHVNHNIKRVTGDFYYDKYSEYRFHKYIQARSIQRVLLIALSWDPKIAKNLIQTLELDEKCAQKFIPIEVYLSFFVLKYCRPFFSLLRFLWFLKHRGNTNVL